MIVRPVRPMPRMLFIKQINERDSKKKLVTYVIRRTRPCNLYHHVIVHIRVELERKVQLLMDWKELMGDQCMVCCKAFKDKTSLLYHIGCNHGEVNKILMGKGYKMLPCQPPQRIILIKD